MARSFTPTTCSFHPYTFENPASKAFQLGFLMRIPDPPSVFDISVLGLSLSYSWGNSVFFNAIDGEGFCPSSWPTVLVEVINKNYLPYVSLSAFPQL